MSVKVCVAHRFGIVLFCAGMAVMAAPAAAVLEPAALEPIVSQPVAEAPAEADPAPTVEVAGVPADPNADSGERGILLEEVAGGLRLVTRPELNSWLRKFFEASGANKFSMAALETLVTRQVPGGGGEALGGAERITLDDWGYPILDATPFGRDLLGHAKAAMTACPVLALRLDALQDDERRVARSRP